jgi:hypothetical protein
LLDEGVRLHGEFDFSATAVNERTSRDDAATGFLDNVNGFFRGTSRSPNILDNKNVLVGFDREATTQGERAAGVTFNE